MHISHSAGARVCENSNDKNVKVCARAVPFCWAPYRDDCPTKCSQRIPPSFPLTTALRNYQCPTLLHVTLLAMT